MNHLFIIISSLLLISCEPHPKQNNTHSLQTIEGRDLGHPENRIPIYRATVPSEWVRLDPSRNLSIADTTKPLCTFVINGNDDQKITITIHNFSSDKQEERIPPSAQIARWKKQFSDLNLASVIVKPTAHGGFAGLFLQSNGALSGHDTTIFGWAMQIAPEYYSSLSVKRQIARSSAEENFFKQMQSDYTIKAIGPTSLVDKHKKEIVDFANSFELIEEIPTAS